MSAAWDGKPDYPMIAPKGAVRQCACTKCSEPVREGDYTYPYCIRCYDGCGECRR